MKWLSIPGYEKEYSISSEGNVFSHKSAQSIKHQVSNNGYKRVALYKDGKYKKFTIHRLVLLTFKGPSNPYEQAAHLDGDKWNNNINNLKWCTPKENSSHKILHGTAQRGEKQGTSKLTDEKVLIIRELYKSVKISYSTLSRIFKISKPSIHQIITRKQWKHI